MSQLDTVQPSAWHYADGDAKIALTVAEMAELITMICKPRNAIVQQRIQFLVALTGTPRHAEDYRSILAEGGGTLRRQLQYVTSNDFTQHLLDTHFDAVTWAKGTASSKPTVLHACHSSTTPPNSSATVTPSGSHSRKRSARSSSTQAARPDGAGAGTQFEPPDVPGVSYPLSRWSITLLTNTFAGRATILAKLAQLKIPATAGHTSARRSGSSLSLTSARGSR